jgi:multiple sugar transport system permease protein
VIVLYSALTAIALVTVFPFLWMISTSLKEPGQALIIPPRLIPNPLIFGNYVRLFSALPFATFFRNSIKISVLVVIGQVFIDSLGGFALGRLDFRGKNFGWSILIGSMMMPIAIRIIPLYMGYNAIGWLDSHYPLILAPVLANTFGTFLFRQFFMTIPDDLEDAAIIDGCSDFRVYWTIMMPQAKAVIGSVAIFAFLHSWNNFLEPLVYLSRMEKFTVPIGLSFFQGQFSTDYTTLMAGATTAVVPILFVYFFAQDYFVKGIITTGLKG